MNKDIEINGNMNLGAYSPLELAEEGVNESLKEKAVSKAQQRFFGMVDAYKKGEMPDASSAIKKAAKGMTKKEVKDFAKTKHKGLPEHVDESVNKEMEEKIRKTVREMLKSGELPKDECVEMAEYYSNVLDKAIGKKFDEIPNDDENCCCSIVDDEFRKHGGKQDLDGVKNHEDSVKKGLSQIVNEHTIRKMIRKALNELTMTNEEKKLRKFIKETAQKKLVDVMARYVRGEASSEEANKAIMDLANSSNHKINENLDPKTENYFEQVKRGERDSLDYNGQIYEVTPQLRKLVQQISEQFGLEVYPYVYQNDVRIFCALLIENNGDDLDYDTVRTLESELGKYGLHCASSFGTKSMIYVKQIKEKNR